MTLRLPLGLLLPVRLNCVGAKFIDRGKEVVRIGVAHLREPEFHFFGIDEFRFIRCHRLLDSCRAIHGIIAGVYNGVRLAAL